MGSICSIITQCLDGQEDVRKTPVVTMDRKYHARGVSVTNFVVVGDGIALANAALHQSLAYWEIKVLDSAGSFCCGVSHRIKPDQLRGHLDGTLHGRHHWAMRFSNTKTGDIISVMLDQSEVPVLHFQLNGMPMSGKSIRGVRGLVFPAVSVSDDARLDANFGPSKFVYPLPRNYNGVIRAQDMI